MSLQDIGDEGSILMYFFFIVCKLLFWNRQLYTNAFSDVWLNMDSNKRIGSWRGIFPKKISFATRKAEKSQNTGVVDGLGTETL